MYKENIETFTYMSYMSNTVVKTDQEIISSSVDPNILLVDTCEW